MIAQALRVIIWCAVLTVAWTVSLTAQEKSPRADTLLRYGWKFSHGNPSGANTQNFDDSAWQEVRVPHDWAIAGPSQPKGDGNNKLPWRGEGWYRLKFNLNSGDAGKRVVFNFDGVMALPQVYVNGKLAGSWDYGYNSFWIDATSLVQFGRENLLAVYVDTRSHGSRWYPGAGIYRKVTMTLTDPLHVAVHGTYVTTPKITSDEATVHASTTIENNLTTAKTVTVISTIVAPDGSDEPVITDTRAVNLPAGGSVQVEQNLAVAKPALWDIRSPNLYTLATTVKDGERVADFITESFGIRTVEFTVDDGFHLNGRRVELKGVNLHHDQGPLGAAFHRRAMQRQLEIMQSMGVNAVRTSHNPPAPELLDLADKMGILVFAECFDKWDATADRASNVDLYTHADKQLHNFIISDRNHPSIFIWSIGNEITEVETDSSGASARDVAAISAMVRKYDPSRKVTQVTHKLEAIKSGMHKALDVQSWNYGWKYVEAKKTYPGMPFLVSEGASTVSSRDYYSWPLPRYRSDFPSAPLLSSYDMNAPDWGGLPDFEFEGLRLHPYVAGEFIWSGFDYLGEPTPYDNISRNSYFGIVDLVGLAKDRFYLYRSMWRTDVNTVHILPHWTWPNDRIGKNTPVFVYTNGDEAELFLNGKSLGRIAKVTGNSSVYKRESPTTESDYDGSFSQDDYSILARYRLMWKNINYEPGTLRAVAYKNGVKIGEEVMTTAGDATQLGLTADRDLITADGDDLSYITVDAHDNKGIINHQANNMVTFAIDGPGEIVGVGNGDERSLAPFVGTSCALFFGKAVVIVRSKPGESGPIHVSASSSSLSFAAIIINTATN